MRRDAAINQTEDLHVKGCEETIACVDSSCGCYTCFPAGCGQCQKRVADPVSKQSRVIAIMLQSSAGATIATIVKTTGWQQHSVRGFLAGVVSKRLKLKLSSKKVDDNRVYRIAGPSSHKTKVRSPREPA